MSVPALFNVPILPILAPLSMMYSVCFINLSALKRTEDNLWIIVWKRTILCGRE